MEVIIYCLYIHFSYTTFEYIFFYYTHTYCVYIFFFFKSMFNN